MFARRSRRTAGARAVSRHTTNSRDSALRRLTRANRWLLAGSVALTGVLSEVAASAFPGKTVKMGSATDRAKTSSAGSGARGSSGSLKAPAQAPRSSPEQVAPEAQAEAAPESQPEQEQPVEAPPEQPVEEGTPETQAEATPEAAPEAAPEAPVVSGGS